MNTSATRRGSRHAAPGAARRFRPDIQGLRAVAVLLVASYHFWFGRVSGGVDVFLMVSAFLMAGSFARRIESGEALTLRVLIGHWVRVFQRIVPLCVLTVLGVLLATRLWYPPSRWHEMMSEAVSVVLYWNNWFSAATDVDYYATDTSLASPLRHFWSLSVQGQIFILWPILFAVAGWVIGRRRLPVRSTLSAWFGIIGGASFVFSVLYTAADQEGAYFNTWARAWEFALGTLVAFAAPALRLPEWLRTVMGWLGLSAIVACGFVLDVEGAFPGWGALWPTVAASCVIVSGQRPTRWGVERLLSLRPLVWLGGRSYALYLVHWPLLVFYLVFRGGEKATPWAGLGLLGVSILAAAVLTAAVETPLRRWAWPNATRRRGLAWCAAMIAVVRATVVGWNQYISYMTGPYVVQNAAQKNPGAQAVAAGAAASPPGQGPSAKELPYPTQRVEDLYSGEASCESEGIETGGLEDGTCFHPVRNDQPSATVMAVGNSHTEQWLTALSTTAERRGWDLIIVIKHGCFLTTSEDNSFDETCQEWAPQAQQLVLDRRPDLLFTQGTASTYTRDRAEGEYIRPGTEDFLARAAQEGTDVVAFRDNPRFEESHEKCERLGSACDFPNPIRAGANPLEEWVGPSHPGFGTMDMNDLICPHGVCSPSVGNVYTYVDDNHLTATFVATTQPVFEERLDRAIDQARAARA